ncbi:MAG: Gfo/Idh/MocA family oxidoreductase [Planctomycetaceae bacterium]|jgi:predicted dehydrogenase|nr:Gfo/Idh/MocA family oxidoreductase [Phycisphaerales bacterium]MCE2652204.1 Gfo/Idh/MocA family oxidoreductase [Planctomycetaceae bacterium]
MSIPPAPRNDGRPLADTSRRSFLATTAGALAATALASTTLGKGDEARIGAGTAKVPTAAKRAPLAKDGTIKLGLIGMGGPGQGSMGTGHATAFTNLVGKGRENAEFVALCDVNKLNMEYCRNALAKAGQKTVPDTYGDYKKMLAREDIHGVIIATPEHWHAQMAIDAIAAGKDVYLEKPMTLNLPDALALRAVALANPDIRLQVGTQMTNLPKYHEARKVIQSGKLGPITMSQTSYCRNSKNGEWNYYVLRPEWKGADAQWIPGDNLDWDAWCGPLGKMAWDPKLYSRWRRYRKTSTGILGDLLVHVITPMLVALGPDVGWPKRVVANGAHLVDKEMENHDNVSIAVQFESGHLMNIIGSTTNEVGLETLIRGNKGNIYLNSRHCVVRPERTYSEDFDEQTIQCPDIGNDQDMHRLKWCSCIRTRELPDSDVEQGSKVMVIVDLATRSIWDGGAWEFDYRSLTARKV